VSQRIAFFDFDGTITTKDTLLEFIRFSNGSFRFCLGFALSSPWILAYKLKLIPNQQAKEKVLRFFFRHCPLTRFQEECDRFSREALPALIRPKALREITRLQAAGTDVVIVSASPGNWIRGWADHVNAALIATRLETTPAQAIDTPARPTEAPTPSVPETLTGNIEGRNCYGLEKVSRIQQEFDLSVDTEIYTYGDTSGDRPMLQLGTASFFKPFR
jgi:phosphatidylglycerophosphatase C